MARELRIIYTTGATVTAEIINAADGATHTASLTESPTGYYVGNFPSLAAATYDIAFFDGSTAIGAGEIQWDGSQAVEFDAATLAAIKSQTDKINTSNIIVLSSIATGSLQIVAGDDYINTGDNRALLFTKPQGANWPASLSGFTVSLNCEISPNNFDADSGDTTTLTISGTVVDNSNVRFEITGTTTAACTLGQWTYKVVATKAGSPNDIATLAIGGMRVL